VSQRVRFVEKNVKLWGRQFLTPLKITFENINHKNMTGRELHFFAYETMMKYHRNNPDFKFWFRQRDERKLLNGLIFQGNETYAFVGLYTASGGLNRTKSVGVVFFLDKNGNVSIFLENAFKGIEDVALWSFYNDLRDIVGGFKKMSPENFKKFFPQENQDKELDHFAFAQKPLIDKLIRKHGLEILLISDKKFEADLLRVQKYIQIQDPSIYNPSINSLLSEPDDAHPLFHDEMELFKDSNIARTTSTQQMVAHLLSDSEKGRDYLDIKKDVVAFARSISAKQFTPPLAIALFGKWGAGKSFFMHKLKEEIDEYSKSSSLVYCKGIAQIHFNAWSYLDANLWASIVTRIFEGLQEYISGDEKASSFKNEIERELNSQLSIAKVQVDHLKKEQEKVTAQLNKLEIIKSDLETEVQKYINKIERETFSKIVETVEREFDIQSRVKEEIDGNGSITNTVARIRETLPEEYRDNPVVLIKEAKSNYVFLREFLFGRSLSYNLLWIGFFLVLILWVPFLLDKFANIIKVTDFTLPKTILTALPVLSIIFTKANKAYKRLHEVISPLWKIKEDYDQKVKKAMEKKALDEKALKIKIEENQARIIVIDQQIDEISVLKDSLEFKINNALATETLYNFIDKRSNSQDYKKHLGIVSIIRSDLEILSSLFNEHNAEKQSEELREKAEKFRSKFKRPLERIVLYIDDLDRCPEDRVVEVLEAVNLLMAFPLFVVVVGVDPRWVKNALNSKYKSQFNNHSNLESVTSSDYLEKIFQVPFHLKEATDIDVKKMVKNIAGEFLEETNISNPSSDNEEDDGGDFDESDFDSEDFFTDQANPNKANIQEDTLMPLVLSYSEINYLQSMSCIIGNNPRAIKRFVNTYRIVKAHESFAIDSTFEERELLAIIFILALSIGIYKKAYPSFKNYIKEVGNQHKILSQFLNPNNIQPEDTNLVKTRNSLYGIVLDEEKLEDLLKMKIFSFNSHIGFIERFTFDD
jgi:hypothetical protein